MIIYIGLSLSFITIGILYYLNNELNKKLKSNNRALLALQQEFSEYQVKQTRYINESVTRREIRFDNVAKSIKKLHDLGFLVVVITNQSAINRGLMTHNQLENIHNTIQENLISSKTKIDAFYYCPHTPDELCFCRKPKPELILRASDDLNIKLDSSWFFGDSESDIIAGKSAGCKSSIA